MRYLVLPAKPSSRSGPRASLAVSGLAFIALAAVSALTVAAAQEPATDSPAKPSATQPAGSSSASGTRPSDQSSISVTVRVVNVPVTVLDRRGLPVIDLTQGDFRV